MGTEQRQASSKKTAPKEEAPQADPKGTARERGEKLRAALDDLVDEIDEVLEENAEEFVSSYVQRGGE